MASEEWRLCTDWLVRCRILPVDHRATRHDAKVFDLAQTLRDGVLLCHLLNNVCPGSVDFKKEFSQRPQMSQFLCLKNIRTFLQTCKNVFGLRDSDLFDSYDLFEVKDFKKVLHTLSRLSKAELTQRSGISGFPTDNTILHDHEYYNTLEELATGFPPEYSHRHVEDDDGIYGDLRDMALENDVPDDEIYDTVENEDEDKIYDVLITNQSPERPPRLIKPKEPMTKREMCIQELTDTEKNYVDALQMIVTYFIKPLKNILSQADKHIIFAYIEKMLEVHTGFHSELHRACNTQAGTISKISTIFVKWKTNFLIYGDFCSNLPRAQDHIEEVCKKNDLVRLHIDECQKKANNGKFRLRDLLSVPMQRVLKYHLLLKELIKQTDLATDERRGLERALEAMQDLSLYVNEVKRDNETLHLIGEIQSSIVDLQMPANTSLKDYGRLQKDGELRVRCHADNKMKQRYIFLFDKVMLMCKSRMVDKLLWGETYSYKEALVLGEYKVEETCPSRDQARKNDRWIYSFMIVKKNKQNAYTFFAKTDEMKRKWIEAIDLALDNVQPECGKNVGVELSMHTFEKPTDCDICRKLLRGVFYQGYYSPERLISVHKECIEKVGQVPAVPPRPPSTQLSTEMPVVRAVLGRARTMHKYTGVPSPGGNLPILSFDSGEVIDILSMDRPSFWEGRLRGEEGFFPADLVVDNCRRPQRRPTYISPNTSLPLLPKSNDDLPSSVDDDINDVNIPPPCGGQGYVNTPSTDLLKFPWFVGELSRDMANVKLDCHKSGTYLIRESNNPLRKGEYALSIKFGDHIKHIKVERSAENNYYLADCKYFHDLPDLVAHYQETTLSANFPELDTMLVIPYKLGEKVCRYAIAVYDYAATATNQLSLHVDDKIKILSKAGEDRGWWKGENAGKIGYFPMAYVTEEED